ncbi:hypothetical protein J1614_009494 [Plenodomus biglobosus]|nr:hypothetical protein J1614_009494 [Plenodomus biglobosus]
MRIILLSRVLGCLFLLVNSLSIHSSPFNSSFPLTLASINTTSDLIFTAPPQVLSQDVHDDQGAVTSAFSSGHTFVSVTAWDPNDVATPEELTRYATKGSAMRCLMEATDKEAGQSWPDPLGRTPYSASSAWRGTLEGDLNTWYWKEGYYSQENCFFGDADSPDPEVAHARIESALRSLGLDIFPATRGGQNTCYSIEHFDENARDSDGDEIEVDEQHYVVNGQLRQATGAHYRFGLNRRDGAMYIQSLLNPATGAEHNWDHDISLDELPSLRQASDVIFAFWLRQNPDPKNIKYYFVNQVINEDTVPLVKSILKKKRLDRVPYWPGVVLPWQSGEAAVLIGSPIGATLAYMLIQHKLELGIKQITQVVIFRENMADDNPEIQLLFKIGDVPKPIGEVETEAEAARGRVASRGEGDGEQGYVDGVRTHILYW